MDWVASASSYEIKRAARSVTLGAVQQDGAGFSRVLSRFAAPAANIKKAACQQGMRLFLKRSLFSSCC
jgi:hypothetical protein